MASRVWLIPGSPTSCEGMDCGKQGVAHSRVSHVMGGMDCGKKGVAHSRVSLVMWGGGMDCGKQGVAHSRVSLSLMWGAWSVANRVWLMSTFTGPN